MSNVDRGQHGDRREGEGEAPLLRARLSAILDTTLDPLLLARPVRDASGEVIDFVIADMNAPHTRAGGDRFTTTRMHLPERSAELLAMYRRVLATETTESKRRIWIGAHPHDPTSTAGWADIRATGVAGEVVVSWRNVDADVATEERLRVEALQDPLTQLPNRRAVMNLLAAACITPDAFGLMFVDIDHFKSINDRHGHVVGDAVLVATGRRLLDVLGEHGVVGRLAGDEFVVLARHLTNPDELRSIAERMEAAGSAPHRVPEADAVGVGVSLSIGALWVPAAARRRDVVDVLRAADALMYVAKRGGGGRLQVGELPTRSHTT
jgi:diguanylate cyclase